MTSRFEWGEGVCSRKKHCVWGGSVFGRHCYKGFPLNMAYIGVWRTWWILASFSALRWVGTIYFFSLVNRCSSAHRNRGSPYVYFDVSSNPSSFKSFIPEYFVIQSRVLICKNEAGLPQRLIDERNTNQNAEYSKQGNFWTNNISRNDRPDKLGPGMYEICFSFTIWVASHSYTCQLKMVPTAFGRECPPCCSLDECNCACHLHTFRFVPLFCSDSFQSFLLENYTTIQQ